MFAQIKIETDKKKYRQHTYILFAFHKYLFEEQCPDIQYKKLPKPAKK